jgi:O-antigen/teichoic acid export membrane protein
MSGKRLLSMRYTLLRASTAAGTLGTGLLQTFVFARVLSPEQFSLFIFFAAVGFTLYAADAGMVKVLFVDLRGRFLEKRSFAAITGQATGLVSAYFLVTALGTLACFLVLKFHSGYASSDRIALTLFFAFNAINLPWVALRYFSIAIDEYVFFETLEAARRGLTTLALVIMLFGLPIIGFVVLINLGWIVVIAAAIARLARRGVLGGEARDNVGHLLVFFRSNKRQIFNSAVYAVSEMYIYNFPYFLVPWVYGLGAPTIILDTAFKVIRAANQFYSAACDSLVPRQTSALAERDGSAMVRATWLATALCGVPALGASLVLIVAGKWIFAILLGPAAVMPPQMTPVIILLLFGNLAQMVSHSVLVLTGYFKEVARVSFGLMVAMTAVAVATVVLHLDIVQFLNAFASTYTLGALVAIVLMIRGPIRQAHEGRSYAMQGT